MQGPHSKRGPQLCMPLNEASVHQHVKGFGAVPVAYQTLGSPVSTAEQVELLQLLSLLLLNRDSWKRTKGNHQIQSLHVRGSFT